MNPFFYLCLPSVVLVCCIVLASLIAYPIVINVDTSLPLAKIISRLTQGLLVLTIFPAMYYLHLDRQQLGFHTPRIFIVRFIQGFALGLVTLFPVLCYLYAVNVHLWDTTQVWTGTSLSIKIFTSFLAALAISLLEEPLFRGILLLSLQKQLSTKLAILGSAFYYASLHFLQAKYVTSPQTANIEVLLSLFGQAVANLLNPDNASAWLALFVVGIFLGQLRNRHPMGLALCIGCHTSWVFEIKMSKALFNPDYFAPQAFWINHYDGVIGNLVSLWLVFVLGLLSVYQTVRRFW